MSNMNQSETAGNRFSLRNKPSNQIKRVDAISNTMGAVGELLVSTWGGIMLGIGVLGFGAIVISTMLMKNGGATLVPNLLPAFIVLISTVLIAVNVVMTNPSMGSQFIVSIKFLIRKANNRSRGKTQSLNIFKLNELGDAVVIDGEKRQTYVAVYSVRGSYSPVSFADELAHLERLDRQLLTNMERDTVISSVNSIQKASVKPIPLPRNASIDMIARRDRLYNIVANLKHNQQLKTSITVACSNEVTLRERTQMVERVFSTGLVIGYQRLSGKTLKNEVKRIYD